MFFLRAFLALTLLFLPRTILAAPDAGAGTRSQASAKRPDAGASKRAKRPPAGTGKRAARPDAGAGKRAARPDAGAGKRSATSASKRAAGAKRVKVPRNPTIQLFHVNTKETFRLRFADDRGRPIKGWQKRFQRFMRCHYTQTQHRMHPRLPRLLYQIGKKYYGHRIEVVSGYRSPKIARNPKSPHKTGLACDFRVAGVANAALRDYLRNTFDHIGVGYYPNSSFVHLDVRKGPSAFWIDYSGPGENASYSRNAGDDLRTGRVDWYTTGTSRSRSTDAGSIDHLMEMAVKGTAPQRAAEVAPTR